MNKLAQVALIGTTSVIVAGVGTAYAVNGAAAPSPVIHACKAKKGGAVRIVAKSARCRSTETRVTWNQRGPKGDRGPSDAYASSDSHELPTSDVTVAATLRVPAGSYVFQAQVYLRYIAQAGCWFGPFSSLVAFTPYDPDLGEANATLPLTAAINLAAPTNVTVSCYTNRANSATYAAAQIVATRVGALHVQNPSGPARHMPSGISLTPR